MILRARAGLVPVLGVAFCLVPLSAWAASADLSGLIPKLNLLAFLVCAGLCLRKVGHVRSPAAISADIQCFAVFVAAVAAFWLLGFDLLRTVSGTAALIPGVVGGFALTDWHVSGARSMLLELAAAAIAGQIVTGVLAERIKLLPLVLFTIVLAAVLFPIAASWQWGGGWLADRGFIDFGGASFLHSLAGWAALAGAIVLGGRPGRFALNIPGPDIKNHSGVLMVLGTLILWVGWQGLVGGLRAGAAPMTSETLIHLLINTNAAAIAGLVAATLGSLMVPRWFTVDATLNGLIAGLVAISANPVDPNIFWSLGIGAGAGLLAAFVPIALEHLRIDDVTGSIPAHLCAGIWGTLAVSFTTPGANFGVQLLGVTAIGAFAFVASFAVFLLLQILFGLRNFSAQPVAAEHSVSGTDAR